MRIVVDLLPDIPFALAVTEQNDFHALDHPVKTIVHGRNGIGVSRHFAVRRKLATHGKY
jgi:hypothetical protein